MLEKVKGLELIVGGIVLLLILSFVSFESIEYRGSPDKFKMVTAKVVGIVENEKCNLFKEVRFKYTVEGNEYEASQVLIADWAYKESIRNKLEFNIFVANDNPEHVLVPYLHFKSGILFIIVFISSASLILGLLHFIKMDKLLEEVG